MKEVGQNWSVLSSTYRWSGWSCFYDHILDQNYHLKYDLSQNVCEQSYHWAIFFIWMFFTGFQKAICFVQNLYADSAPCNGLFYYLCHFVHYNYVHFQLQPLSSNLIALKVIISVLFANFVLQNSLEIVKRIRLQRTYFQN